MIELIDVEKYRKKAATRFILHLFVICFLTVGVILGSVFSLIYSSLDYQLNLILNIVGDSLFGCFLVFYFFTIFPVVSHYYKIFKKINTVAYEHRRNVTYVEERAVKTMSNVKFRTLNFSYKEGENIYLENLYVLDNDIALKAGAHYSIYSYHNIIIKLEELDHATAQ